jgi:hypothetical protein
MNEFLGHHGKMISGSKSGYRDSHPRNLAVFNANVCVGSEKVWHGDIDVTKEISSLQQMAQKENSTVYVLMEMDGRFENEESPKIDNFMVKVNPDGSYELGNYVKTSFEIETLLRKENA